MKRVLLFIFYCLVFITGHGQLNNDTTGMPRPWGLQWIRFQQFKGSSYVNDMAPTTTGGFVVAGAIDSSSATDSLYRYSFLSSYNNDGYLEWQHIFPFKAHSEMLVRSMHDGNYLFGANSRQDNGGGVNSILFKKLSKDGAAIWNIDFLKNTYASIWDMAITHDNGFIASVDSASAIRQIYRFDSLGKKLWSARADSIKLIIRIAVTGDGSSVTMGKDAYSSSLRMHRFDPAGKKLFSKVIKVADPIIAETHEWVDLKIGKDGSIYVAGSADYRDADSVTGKNLGMHQGFDFFLMKLDGNGNKSGSIFMAEMDPIMLIPFCRPPIPDL